MEPRSYSRYLLTVLCCSVVVTALILVILNARYGQPKTSTSSSEGVLAQEQDAAYAQGYEAARQELIELGNAPPVNERIMSGTARSIQRDQLMVGERTVKFSNQTVVYKETLKSDEVFQKEIQAFSKSLASQTSQPDSQPPTRTIRTQITADVIPAGARVTVTAKDPIRSSQTIEAAQIVYHASVK